MTRRHWMLSTGAGVGTLSAYHLESAQQRRPEIPAIKLGVTSNSFGNADRPHLIEMARQLGAPYLSLRDSNLPLTSTPEQLEQARKEFQDARLTIASGGTISFRLDDEQDIRSKFEYAKHAGMPMIICMPKLAILPKLGKFVEEFNIRIAVHNHVPENPHDTVYPTTESALTVLRDMDPRCGVCIDIEHTVRSGLDVVRSIASAGSRLFNLHMKDLKDPKIEGTQCDCGDGVMPFPAIFGQLMKMAFEGYCDLEYEVRSGSLTVGVQRSFYYLRGTLAGVGFLRSQAG